MSVSLAVSVLTAALMWEPLDDGSDEYGLVMWAFISGALIFSAGLIYFVARRHNWARILTLLLTIGATAMFFIWPEVIADEPWWSVAISVATTLMDLAALYWLFIGNGAKWYSSPSAT